VTGVQLVKEDQLKWDVPTGILCMILGTLMIYSLLFTIGYILYGNYMASISLGLIAVSSGFMLSRYWTKLRMD
jgi:solute:Na+ symporter, SSS family